MATINQQDYDVNRNLVGLPNVVLIQDKNPLDTTKFSYQTNLYIYKVLHPLMGKPWTFMPQHTRGKMDVVDGKNVRIITDFFIYEGSEYLGSVGISYVGSGYKIAVDNHRIADSRKSGRAFRTENLERATLTIRKNFYRMPDAERVEKVMTGVGNQLQAAHWDTQRELAGKERAVYERARDFAASNMAQYIHQYPDRGMYVESFEKAKLDHDTTVHIIKMQEKDELILVVRESEHYIVKVGGTISSMTDDALSMDLRAKLGMLKLVENGQCIEGMGFRGDENTFLITPEVVNV
jgi:hypothetical protein